MIVIPKTKLIEGLCNLTVIPLSKVNHGFLFLACDLCIMFFLESRKWKWQENDDLKTFILEINHKQWLYLYTVRHKLKR